MSDLESRLSANRAAMSSFLAAAKSVASEQWAQPVAPGKWSPAQIADHVAISYEVAVRVIAGDSKMGSAPRFVRPIVRAVGFNRILRNGAFPEKLKGPQVFAPSTGHPSYEASAARLEKAVASLESQARDMARAGARGFDHPIFGRVSVADYVRFSELHARHHESQLPIQRAPRTPS
jgi:hypothetical protein